MKFFNEFEKIEKTEHNLPHWNQPGVPIFVTWRLHDSLPKLVVEKWRRDRDAWLKEQSEPWDDQTKQEYQRRFVLKLERFLDDCHGSCVLEQAKLREIVVDSLHFYDGRGIDLDCYVVMPNHVHCVFALREGKKLEKVMQSIKGFSAREVNKRMARKGALWQSDYWDRLIRSESHLRWVRRYVTGNPEGLRKGRFSLWMRER